MIEKNSGKFPHWMVYKTRDSYLRRIFLDGQIDENRIAHIENVIGFKRAE